MNQKPGVRLPTGQCAINEDTMKSIGFTTNTKIEDRAVTRQGLQGIAPLRENKIERKIQDKSYYLTLFKTKINDIGKEIFGMNNEIGVINSDLTTYGNLNKTFETLTKEVQNLEGELADYNLAGDKYRSQMKAENIAEVYTKIKMYNQSKMQSNENSIFSLQTYIDSKTNDNKFGSLLKDCMDLQEKINEEILKHF